MAVNLKIVSQVVASGIPGPAGRSAYQIAVDNGFEGTESEWLKELHPFKGWFDTVSELEETHPTPSVGDYAYVKGATSSDPVKIYECSTEGTWSDSGRTVDTSSVQTFGSGEAVNDVDITDDSSEILEDGEKIPTAGAVAGALGNAKFSTGEKVKNVGIDDEPTAGSDNLVKSGGVAEAIKEVGEIVQVQDNTYLYLLLDKNNKIIAGIKHDATLVFNSNIKLNGGINIACEEIVFENPVVISGEPININSNLSVRDNEIKYIDSPTELYAIVDSNNHVLLSISEDGTVYLPKIKSQTIDDKIDKTHDVLYGKKWVVIGDSFTNGASVGNITEKGKYYGSTANYAYIIGNRYNMDIVRFFDGGRTLAFPAIPEDFVNSITCPTSSYYYQNIPSDADYITIYLGINDAHHAPGSSGGDGEDNTGEIPLGTPTDMTTATFYGAWNVVLSWLRENRPFAHVGIIVSNGTGDIAYPQATIEMAKKYGYPYIDLNGDKDTPAMIRSTNPDIPDSVKTAIKNAQMLGGSGGTHPNAAAYRFESKFIESFLKHI